MERKIYDMHIHLRPGDGEPADLIKRFEMAGIYGGAVFSEAPSPMKMEESETGEDAGDYRVEWAQKWLKIDNDIYDNLGLSAESKNRIFGGNMLRFFGISGAEYRYRTVSSDGR